MAIATFHDGHRGDCSFDGSECYEINQSFGPAQMSVQNVTFKTVQVKNGAELFWREEKRTKKLARKIKMAYVHQPI